MEIDKRPWHPSWRLDPEPEGDDENKVRALFEVETGHLCPKLGWDELEEWMREAWRREYRDA